MNNSGNQIRNFKIKQYPKTDRVKLAKLEVHYHQNYNSHIHLEPFLLFSKEGEDTYRDWVKHLEEYHKIHYMWKRADAVFTINDRQVFFELDGDIHDTKKSEQTSDRNERYELNNLPYIVINEAELKLKLGIPKSRPLTQEQINSEFDERLGKI